MKKLTLSVDDATCKHAMIVAQCGTSVSAMVREYLRGLQEKETQQSASWKEFWKELDAARAKVGERPSRARTYDDPRLP